MEKKIVSDSPVEDESPDKLGTAAAVAAAGEAVSKSARVMFGFV